MRSIHVICLVGLFCSAVVQAEDISSSPGFGLGQALYQGGLDLTPAKSRAADDDAVVEHGLLPDMFAPHEGPGIRVRGSLTAGDSGSFSLDPKSIEGAELRISIPN